MRCLHGTMMEAVAKFQVERSREDHFWIRHGNRRVFLFVLLPGGKWIGNAVFLRQPDAGPDQFPADYHSATAMGVQLDFTWQCAVDWLPMEINDPVCANNGVMVRLVRHSRDGVSEQTTTLLLYFDEKAGYVLRGNTRLLAMTTAGPAVEFLNFWPEDAGNSWVELKRFRATIQETDTGVFLRRPHSHLTVLEKYHWENDPEFRKPHIPEPPVEEIYDPAVCKTGKQSLYARSHFFRPLCMGGILYFYGESTTPCVRVTRASAPLVTTACDVWYDEHICLNHGVRQSDGRWLYEVAYEVFRLPEENAKNAAERAMTVEWSEWVQSHEFPAFYCDWENTFQIPASREYYGATGLFYAYPDPEHLISWQRFPGAIVLNTVNPIEPPSGQHYQSVRYGLGDNPWVEAFPIGFFLHLFPGQPARFSARIRTEGGVRAWIEMRDSHWGHFQRQQPGRGISAESHIERSGVVDSPEWSQVEGRIMARIPSGMSMVFLVMEGRGRAFFSNLFVGRET